MNSQRIGKVEERWGGAGWGWGGVDGEEGVGEKGSCYICIPTCLACRKGTSIHIGQTNCKCGDKMTLKRTVRLILVHD